MKEKKCKMCKSSFIPTRPMQTICSFECSIEYAKNKNKIAREKKARKVKKEFKENDKSTLLKLAQMTFNKFIRLRDEKNKCISCDYEWGGIKHQRQAHASHYISTSKSRLLRFNEDNVHKSCQICNTHLSGNLAEYRIRLIKKIGLPRVEELEKLASVSEPCKYTIDNYKEIIIIYKQKIKELSLSL